MNTTITKSKYKQTEIGWIPEDWEIKELREVLEILTDFDANGSFASVAQNVRVTNGNGYAWYVRSTDLENNTPINELRYVDESSYDFLKKSKLFGDELLFLKRGDIGNLYFFKMKTEHATLGPNLYLLKLNNLVENKFLFYYFKSENGNRKLKSINASSTLGAIYKEDVKSLYIPLPPLPEQEAIAAALSDADAWVESLEQLIEKKRLLKQAAMQELLTGRIRLRSPSGETFEGEWKSISLLEIVEGKKALFDDGDWVEAEHIRKKGIRLIQTGDIGVGKLLDKENKKYINEKSFAQLNCKELNKGDILICRLADPAGRACIFDKEYKSITSVDITIFRPDVNEYNREFLMYTLSTFDWFVKISQKVGGTTHKRISRGNLGKIKIFIPELLNEQTAIANVLSAMDAEIEALENQWAKAQQIKQGMMQELLTGRIRLV